MPATPTKTLNPLPFQDLEPHRFEDLVRQLAYDMRHWKSLEATGRGGSDDGLDIRGIEILTEDDETGDDEDREVHVRECLWIFQCKREKSLTPKKMKEVITESLVSLPKPPHGFVIAIACDISKKSRDVFRGEMVSRGIDEFAIWARSELEDMLFQAKNDRLLFAYFGISLQPRRQNLSTLIRSKIAIKKKVAALVDEREHREQLILLRDPSADNYPDRQKKDKKPRWVLCQAISTKNPDGLSVLVSEHLAALTPDGERWDAIFDYDSARVHMENELRSKQAWSVSDDFRNSSHRAHEFWLEHIPEERRATVKVYRWVPYDRILAIDPAGDGYYPVPHLFVDFDRQTGPFLSAKRFYLERASRNGGGINLEMTQENRTMIFPDPMPASDENLPKDFDHTINSSTKLSDENAVKLEKLLNSISEQRNAIEKKAKTSSPTVSQIPAEFRQWREKVAVPVLSSIVLCLREEGHDARVITKSNDPNSSKRYFEVLEGVEIKVKLSKGGLFHNRDYRPAGYYKVELTSGNQLKIEVWPSANGNSSRTYNSSMMEVLTLEKLNKDYLESQVLLVLERLGSNSI